MRRIPPLGIVAGIILIAAIIGGGMGWWVSRDNTTQEAKPVVIADEKNSSQSVTQIAAPASNATTVAKAPIKTEPAEGDNTTTVAAPTTSAENQWQDALDAVITSEGEADQKADRLLQMLPHLKEEAQVEVSQHLVNFTADDHYVPVAEILTNAATLESVSTVLMTDLLNRNDGLKLPLLLAIARNESHPKHDEAKDLLELYLQENHGSNWNEWEGSVTNYLAQNGPDITPPPPSDSAPEPANP